MAAPVMAPLLALMACWVAAMSGDAAARSAAGIRWRTTLRLLVRLWPQALRAKRRVDLLGHVLLELLDTGVGIFRRRSQFLECL